MRTDVFRPVKLPGEFKPRSSEQCTGFSCGFVYTVRDRSHLSPSHHQHDPDLCVDDTMSSDHFSDDQLAQGTSNFECSFASGFDMDANSAMGKLCAGRRDSVDKTCSAVSGSRHPSVVADRAGPVATSLIKNRSNRAHTLPELLVHRANQWASMDVCDNKAWRCGAIVNYCHSAASIAHKEAKAKTTGKKERDYHALAESRTDCRWRLIQRRARTLPGLRYDRELHVFNTASGPILRCRRWSLAGTPRTLIKACHDRAVVPGGLRSTNRTPGGSSPSGSGGPGILPRRDDGIQEPPPTNDWTAQVQALAANPAWAHEQFAQWQLLHQKYQHLQYQQQLVGGVDNGSLASASRGRRIHWGRVEYGHGNGSDWCVRNMPEHVKTSSPL